MAEGTSDREGRLARQPATARAFEIAATLAQDGVESSVLHVRIVKPLDAAA
jgi:transketolase C-terminal domain/subunit